jgi:hypothetical protein
VQDLIAYFKNKKNLINVLILAVILTAIPLGVQLVRNQQVIKSFAREANITFLPGACVVNRNNNTVAICKDGITISLTSPFGPPPSGTQSVKAPSDQFMSLVPIEIVKADEGDECSDDGGVCNGNSLERTRCYEQADGSCGGCVTDGNANDPECAPAQVCTPNEFQGQCTGRCGGCAADAGELAVQQCRPDGSGVDPRNNECSTSCVGPCRGGGTSPRPSASILASARPSATGGTTQGNTRVYIDPSSVAGGTQVTITATGSKTCSTNITNIGAASNAGYTNCVGNPKSVICDGTGDRANPKDGNACWWQWTCTASNTPGNYTVNFDAGGSQCKSSSSLTVTSAPVYTTHFKVAFTRADLAAATWMPYTTDPMEHTLSFADNNRGQKSVWVQFKSSTNQESNPAEKRINFVGADPVISGSVDCDLDTAGNVNFKIKGTNFGDSKGNSRVTVNSSNLSVDDWKDTEVTGKLSSNAATGKQRFDISLTREDGAPAVTQSCSLGIAQVSLGAKLFCQLPSKGTASNVSVSLAEATSSATASARAVKETVSIDTNGLIQGLKTKVQEGKKYKLAIKVPGGLRKQVEFTAASGTTVVPNVSLPVGDIYPAGGDGVINALDKAELNRQWVAGATATGRAGDFNTDGKVNSIDWACMRENFGQSDASDL